MVHQPCKHLADTLGVSDHIQFNSFFISICIFHAIQHRVSQELIIVMNSKPSKPKLYLEVLLQFIAAVLYEVICDATHNTQWILRYHFYLLIKSINISVGVSFKLIAYNLFYLNKYYNGHIMISEWCVETVSSSNSMTIRRINLVG